MLGLFEGRIVITSSSSATGVDGDAYDGSDEAFGEGGSAASSHKRARAVDDFFSSPFTYDGNDDIVVGHQPQECATVARKRAKKKGRGESFPCDCSIGGHRKGAFLPANLFGVFKGGRRKKNCLAGATRAAAERAATRATVARKRAKKKGRGESFPCDCSTGGHRKGAFLPANLFGVFKGGRRKKNCLAGATRVAAERAATRAAALAADPIKFKAERKTASAKYNAKHNARALEASALYDRFARDHPHLAEAPLDSAALAALAGELVAEIEDALQEAELKGMSVGFNVCTGEMGTMKTRLLSQSECWGLTRNRGAAEGRAELIHAADGSHCTPMQLADGGWSFVFLRNLRNPENMNALEKRVHQLLNRDARKLWRRDGAGGVHLDHEVRPEDNVFTIAVVFGPCGAETPFSAGPPTVFC